MILILFLIAHVAACAIITYIKRLNPTPGCGYMMAIMWLIPVVGIALYYADDYVQKHVIDIRRGYRDVKEVTFEINELEMDAERDADMIVPVEEALMEGNEKIRRKLMFQLLDSREADNVRLLQRLAAAEDREIAHFASTSLMEYRRSHEQEIADVAKKLDENSLDRVTLEHYCYLIKDYLESGILPPAIQGTYRAELIKRYQELIKLDPRDMDHRETYLKVLMESKNQDVDAGSVVDETLADFPTEMRSYQLAAEYSYMLHSREGIDKALDMVRDKHVYMNQAGRKWYSFWREEAQ